MKVFAISALFILTIFSSVSSQPVAARLSTIIKKAETFYTSQRLQEAITELQKINKVNPLTPADRVTRGGAYSLLCKYLIEKQGQQKEAENDIKKYSSLALADYGKAIKAKPKMAAAYLGRAKLYKGILNDLKNALFDLSTSISLNGKSKEALINRVQIYQLDPYTDYSKAAADYSRLIKIDSINCGDYYEKQANCYINLKDYAAAADDYTALILMFNNPKYYELRGDMYFHLEKYAEATLDYSFCVKSDFKNKMVRYKRANAYADAGKIDSAYYEYINIKSFFDMAEVNGDIANALNKKYKSNLSKSDIDKSDKFLDVAKNDLLWPFALKTEEDKINFGLIKTALNNSIGANPYNYNSYFWLGEINYTVNLLDSAHAAYTKAFEIMPFESEFSKRAKKCLDEKKRQ